MSLSALVAICRPLSLSSDQKIIKLFGHIKKSPYLCSVKIKETIPDATKTSDIN
jgi:hypothetical protein